MGTGDEQSATGPEGGGPRALDVLDGPAEDLGRIALDLNDTLIRQMFAVSLDLHSALGLIDQDLDNHRVAEKIRHAIGGLDQAIKDLRNIVFGLGNSSAPVDLERRSNNSER